MTIYACSFLEKDFPNIASYSEVAERLITLDLAPQAIKEIGVAAEMIAKKACVSEGLSTLIETKEGKYVSQNARVNSMHYDIKLIDKTIFYDFKDIVHARNKLAHPDEDEPLKDYTKKATELHKKFYEISIWFCSEYGSKCNVKNKNYPGIIYSEKPIIKRKCANVANMQPEPHYKEYFAPAEYSKKSLMGKELTNFKKIEKEKIKMVSPLKAFNLHKKELIQDMKRLSSRVEKEDLNQLTEIVKAMNTELKYQNQEIAHPLIVREMKELEKDLSSSKCNNSKVIASRIAKTTAKLNSF